MNMVLQFSNGHALIRVHGLINTRTTRLLIYLYMTDHQSTVQWINLMYSCFYTFVYIFTMQVYVGLHAMVIEGVGQVPFHHEIEYTLHSWTRMKEEGARS